ncbi:MAG: mechanosensitive ion channel [Reichenbachiella sp.]|uniref:mechanosensitive ion channel domain-containing protein n=1 Tax=Reichenbachiella sp. TaxID=2184521 RepID=UPI002967260A|nr:mechanosensitive ion channel domain-containing protein [Reichenbachiella sp.]MDW3209635.1 mechanosensitive ion channel [Reichenbachiella sp.]
MKIFKLLLLSFILLPLTGISQENQTKEEEKDKIEPIAIPEVSSQAELLVRLIESEYKPVIEKPIISQVKQQTDTLKKELDNITAITNHIMQENLPYRYVESFVKKWDRLISRASVPEVVIKGHTSRIDEIFKELRKQEVLWESTRKAYANKEEIPDELFNRIFFSVDQIKKLKNTMSDSLVQAINVQNQILDLKLEANNYAQELDQALKTQFSTLLSMRQSPIWHSDLDSATYQNTLANNKLWIPMAIDETKGYINLRASSLLIMLVIFSIFISMIFWMRGKLSELKEKDLAELPLGEKVLHRPIGAAVLFTLMASLPLLPNRPLYLEIGLGLFFLIPFLSVTSAIIIKKLRWSIFFLAGMFILIDASRILILSDYTNRFLMLIISAAMAYYFFWLLRNISHEEKKGVAKDIWYRVLFFVSPLFLVGMVFSILANTIGYIYISQLITDGILTSTILALLLGSLYVSLKTLVLLALNTNIAQKSKVFTLYKDQTFRTIKVSLKFFYLITWFYYTAKTTLLWQPILEAYEEIWNWGVTVGSIGISVGGVISFGIILFASWLIANFTKILLQIEFLDRIDLPRGVSMAVGSITNYAIMFLGFFMALSSLGFDLANLGLLAGALGVGIGFGLQNIVGNFISGLILVFERPITIGDIVTVDTIEGEVIAIGIRASKIRQYDGAELIVPNSTLISNNVINWTLSDKRRRIKLVIQTSTEVDPEKVIQWMEEALTDIDGVIKHPPYKAYFESVKEQSYQFYINYWVSHEILRVKNEVNIRVIENLKKHKVIVSAQRKVELLSK